MATFTSPDVPAPFGYVIPQSNRLSVSTNAQVDIRARRTLDLCGELPHYHRGGYRLSPATFSYNILLNTTKHHQPNHPHNSYTYCNHTYTFLSVYQPCSLSTQLNWFTRLPVLPLTTKLTLHRPGIMARGINLRQSKMRGEEQPVAHRRGKARNGEAQGVIGCVLASLTPVIL